MLGDKSRCTKNQPEECHLNNNQRDDVKHSANCKPTPATAATTYHAIHVAVVSECHADVGDDHPGTAAKRGLERDIREWVHSISGPGRWLHDREPAVRGGDQPTEPFRNTRECLAIGVGLNPRPTHPGLVLDHHGPSL